MHTETVIYYFGVSSLRWSDHKTSPEMHVEVWTDGLSTCDQITQDGSLHKVWTGPLRPFCVLFLKILPAVIFVSEATQHPVSSSLVVSQSYSSAPSEVSLCIYSPAAEALRSQSANTNKKHNQADTLMPVSQRSISLLLLTVWGESWWVQADYCC